tara:strand:- start:1881 stop:2423 length:543 start_codon:yes stop_codon:yes gene_type:complete
MRRYVDVGGTLGATIDLDVEGLEDCTEMLVNVENLDPEGHTNVHVLVEGWRADGANTTCHGLPTGIVNTIVEAYKIVVGVKFMRSTAVFKLPGPRRHQRHTGVINVFATNPNALITLYFRSDTDPEDTYPDEIIINTPHQHYNVLTWGGKRVAERLDAKEMMDILADWDGDKPPLIEVSE